MTSQVHAAIAANVARAETFALQDGATHSEIAQAMIRRLTAESGVPPRYDMGALYVFEPAEGLWEARHLDQLAADIGAEFTGLKLCRKHSDYRQIAQLIATCASDEDFFVSAEPGIAAAGRFYRIGPGGLLSDEPLTAEHRQRTAMPQAPAFGEPAPLFERLLDHAFGIGDVGDAQRELLQMALGAALCGSLWRYRTVIVLFGPSAAGKSTVLEILKAFFPRDRVGAINPQSWGNEYFAAALAPLALNLVGELDPTTPIQGGVFKAVTGGDPIGARHPTHRPFSFVCQAAHVFNCNRLPPAAYSRQVAGILSALSADRVLELDRAWERGDWPR
ncbi:MAG: hypothetical protein KDG55_08750 [Rhodocyclaceae bacterium]|nr:hypothetical protein [Rhodocyclaceae bacterium]